MATLNRMLMLTALVGLGFPACGKLVGLHTPVTPLAQIHVQVTGDIASVQGVDAGEQAPQLRVALVWGLQWLPEPFCVVPPESVVPVHVETDWKSPSADAVVKIGCPDNFRFVPDVDGADVAVEPDGSATIDLINLPRANVMVGDLTSRIAYASLIAYDDRNGNGTLDFYHPLRRRDEEHYNPGTPATRDLPYGASFINMTLPDQRIAYLEGTFNRNVAFYPRNGCDPPPASFSILSAGGFPRPSSSQLLAEALQPGDFPLEDKDTCRVDKLDEAVVTIPLQLPAGEGVDAGAIEGGDTGTVDGGDVGAVDSGTTVTVNLKELACTVTNTDGTTRYHEPPATAPDLHTLDWACVGFPHLPGDNAGVVAGSQLVVVGAPDDACQSVNHYTLRGCDDDPGCAKPSWDATAPRPDWWPCP